MPAGTPRTDEERRERHREIYGNTDIPKERRGLGSRKLSANGIIELVLVLGILYFLWMIMVRAGV